MPEAEIDWAEVYHLVHTMVLVNGYPRQLTVAQKAQQELDELIPPKIPPNPSQFAPNQSTQPIILVTTAGPLGAVAGNIATTGPNAGVPQTTDPAATTETVTAARGEAGATGPFPAQSQPARSNIPPIPPDDKHEHHERKKEEEKPKRSRW